MAAFADLKKKRAVSFAVFEVSEGHGLVTLERLAGAADTYGDFMDALPPADCRFAVYDFQYRNADDCVFNKLVFVMWSPDGALLKKKMLYASTKDFFKTKLDGITLELQATDVDEVTEEAMREHVAAVLTRS